MHGDLFHIEHGSPPHAWGIHRFQARISACPRFTPTCMGNTIGAPAVMVGSSVHPHMHGEYAVGNLQRAHLLGSPPHAWGIHPTTTLPANSLRFTPTCMGNTMGLLGIMLLITVHPHMHGEYVYGYVCVSIRCGSPPHAWGILLCETHCVCARRFTPTCMGNTLDQ